ncbi:hypothetical protein DFH06DRAFT_559940 [Mycena polygramma]|nr:hypothetical protein DFH06DRAFT_559940 [Mycena polygramma]
MSNPNTNATAPAIILVNPVTAIGPFFFGNTLNWLLLGLLWMQVYRYWCNYPKDKVYIKIFVYTVFTIDLLQTGFTTHAAWWFMIQNWGNVSVIQSAPRTISAIPIACGLISAPVQLFYAIRIWVLSKRPVTRVLAILIAALGLAQSLVAIIAAGLLRISSFQANLLKFHPHFVFWLAGAFTTDIMIAACMSWILQTAKSSSNARVTQTNGMLNQLILNSVQTGMVTVVAAGVQLALFVKFTDTNYHLAVAYLLGKLYSNSFMVTLNMRAPRKRELPSDSIGMRIQVSRTTDNDSRPTAQEDVLGNWKTVTETNNDSSSPDDYHLKEHHIGSAQIPGASVA